MTARIRLLPTIAMNTGDPVVIANDVEGHEGATARDSEESLDPNQRVVAT